MTQDMSSFLLGGGAPGLKFDVGTEHTLTITQEPELRQRTKFGTGEPEWWDKQQTQPKMQLIVTGTVDESERDGSDDDLVRKLYVKGDLQKAVGNGLREAGAKTLAIGGKLWVKCTGEGQAEKGMNPPKLYKAAYKAPEGGAAAFFGTGDGGGLRAPAGKAPAGDEPPFHNGFAAGNPYRDSEVVI